MKQSAGAIYPYVRPHPAAVVVLAVMAVTLLVQSGRALAAWTMDVATPAQLLIWLAWTSALPVALLLRYALPSFLFGGQARYYRVDANGGILGHEYGIPVAGRKFSEGGWAEQCDLVPEREVVHSLSRCRYEVRKDRTAALEPSALVCAVERQSRYTYCRGTRPLHEECPPVLARAGSVRRRGATAPYLDARVARLMRWSVYVRARRNRGLLTSTRARV